jgi:hypothetical protein
MNTTKLLSLLTLSASVALLAACAKKDDAAAAASSAASSASSTYGAAVKAAEDTKAKVEAKAGEATSALGDMKDKAAAAASDMKDKADAAVADVKDAAANLDADKLKAQAESAVASAGGAFNESMVKVSNLMSEQKYGEAAKLLEGLTNLSPEQKAAVDQLKASVKMAQDMMGKIPGAAK